MKNADKNGAKAPQLHSHMTVLSYELKDGGLVFSIPKVHSSGATRIATHSLMKSDKRVLDAHKKAASEAIAYLENRLAHSFSPLA